MADNMGTWKIEATRTVEMGETRITGTVVVARTLSNYATPLTRSVQDFVVDTVRGITVPQASMTKSSAEDWGLRMMGVSLKDVRDQLEGKDKDEGRE